MSENIKMRAYNTLDKFRLLMWKNFVLQYRHKVQTLIQIFIPVVFNLFSIMIRSMVKPIIYMKNTTYQPFAIDNLSLLRSSTHNIHLKEWKLVYSPKNEVLEQLLSQAANALELEIEGVNTPDQVESVMMDRELLAGVLFHHPAELTELPRNLNYTLRFPSECRINPEIDPTVFNWYSLLNPYILGVASGESKTQEDPILFNWHTNLLYPLFSGGGPRSNQSNTGGEPFYFGDGFLPIQDAIARSFITTKYSEITRGNYEPIPEIRMHRFPYPPYTHDILLYTLESTVGIFVMLSFVYPVISTVRFIAIEKEKQLKEMMKIMGIAAWMHWTTWFTHTMIMLTISISFVVVCLKIPQFDSSISVFTNSNWFVIWIFLFVYGIAMTTFCFMISEMFSTANTAAAVAGLVWFVSYIPYTFITMNNVDVPFAVKIICMICSPNVAMAYGCKVALEFEGNSQGLQWSDFWDSSMIGSNLTIGEIILCMLFSSIAFLLITLYIEKVFPGEFGVPEKWNFLVQRNFWCNTTGIEMEQSSSEQSTYVNNENFESEPAGCIAGVQVKNLRKVFANKKVACNGVTFNLFHNQITVLLGHNGAGKSTIIKILIGMTPPSSGTAIINGYDIRTDLKSARKSIGICPQHDILFDELTVREHIEFYSQLKGLKSTAVEKEVEKYVKLLNLQSKIDTPSHVLSGGMQRRLSFGVALCGDSKVVLCDEPTSGVDPAARRELWNILQREKTGRTIIITTHFMDEADFLGDRLLIMADGEVKCSGTSFFLKKRFGSGYRLICKVWSGCSPDAVTQLIQKFVPEAKIVENDAEKLSYILPYERSNEFARMFVELKEKQSKLRVNHFNITVADLEEVFLKVGSDNVQSHQIHSDETIISNIESSKDVELLQGYKLRFNQWHAMLKKRFYCWRNEWYLFLVQNLIIILSIVLSVVYVKISRDSTELPSLNIWFDSYENTVTMLKTPQTDNTYIESIVTKYRVGFEQNSKYTLDEFNEGMNDHILKISNQLLVRSNTRYLVGLSYENGAFVAWFNNQLFHSAPLSLNLLHNSIIRSRLGTDHSIHVSNWPLTFRSESKVLLSTNGDDLGSKLAINISFVMAFISAIGVMFYIRERISKAKLLQFICGVDGKTFWMSSISFDFSMHLLSSLVFYITVVVFQEKYWSNIKELTPLFIVLIIFGLTVLAITVVMSFLFSHASYGFVSLSIIYIFTGITIFNIIQIMSLPIVDLIDAANTMKWFFLIFPHYALANSLFNLNLFRLKFDICQLQCEQTPNCVTNDSCDTSVYGWDEPGIGRNLTYMALVAITFFIILWIIECRIIHRIFYYIRSFCKQDSFELSVEDDEIDTAVMNEKIKVNNISADNLHKYSLVVRNLHKSYGDFKAVKGICVAIKCGECFGLLGANGAGKTSTFKMITGDASISSGDVFVNGLNLKTHLDEVQRVIGYCPQFDALLDNLTGSKTLEIFGLLRGYRTKDISALSDRLATQLNFSKHIDRPVGTYSGGNKRKLSTAIALIGNPVVVYLDEPSSGCDPGAKRNLWNVVSEARKSGASIVITSHSMEEVEALCTKLAIMVKGDFKCLGSIQSLKVKYSKGMLLTVKVRPGSENTKKTKDHINTLIHKNFPGTQMKGKYHDLLTYYVPQLKEGKWSIIFDCMETLKRKSIIEDYSICQPTLDEVFLSFVKPYD